MEDPRLSALLVHEIANPINNISAALYLMEEYFIEKEQPVGEPVGGLLKLLREEIRRVTLLLSSFRSIDLLGSV